jgi:hypothetical protein
VDVVTVNTEKDAERGEASTATCFVRYLTENGVQLGDGVTPEQFAAEAEALAHELVPATVGTKDIYTTPVIASQFESIANSASSIVEVLDKSRFVRDEMEWLLASRLLESWGRQAFRSESESLTDERCRAIERESERIHDFLATHPIEELVRAIVENARAGQRGAAKCNPDTPEQRPKTIRDETIASRCADVFEKLTSHRAARTNIDLGDQQEQVGPFRAYVNVVCDRISEILRRQGIESLRPHPSDWTLRGVIKNRRR